MLGHDLSYLLEVLNIGDGETEDELDERLRLEAKELGVDVDEQKTLEIKPFRPYYPEYPRRSESIDSRASQSTGLTSNYSDLSKDYHGHRRPSRTSLSFRDYDAFVARGVPVGRHSISFSPLSTPSHSTFSLPLSQPSSPDPSPKRHFRRIRGLSMLRLHQRLGSDTSLAEGCPHCPQDLSSQRRAVHKLPCGHRLCTQALRNTVRTATESKTGAVPSCCGRPIPGGLVEHVMTQEEQNALLEKLEQWDEAISLAPSINSSRRGSIPSIQQQQPRPGALSQRSRTVSDEWRYDNLSFKQRKELERMMEREDYKLLRTGQGEQRDRFLRWADKERSELEKKHETSREERRNLHETAVEDMVEHHATAIAEAEDKQVKAESDLRETQEQEKRDNATALKHIEAFCAGTYSTGELHNRPVTDQSLAELDKARRTRDQMDAKHSSQINVLRGEQSRRMRLRCQRQERELQELKRQQRKEELEMERACTAELLKLDESVAEKRRKIRWRWELQIAIFTKKVESETGIQLGSNCRLPTKGRATFTTALRSEERRELRSRRRSMLDDENDMAK
ncbi:hypothetical protein M409DRAFT_64134 [Zasmidium cellare ATCC 36951]|uniref:Uncharacterized protein n=1 Tax=Zasmidium cellare ATCC 36951 TaxID=1080233 RepID=A0A6A6CX44_ZASCE|nr:uncharacterized protein M409DRAFT_64134 [Zasmidium cellare ATCC 36951]KAF2170369.1 hypothetical protein M409DRAFT_64134 [Zasmidium cellare ATCC 36951]